jgi:hypothetical protein
VPFLQHQQSSQDHFSIGSFLSQSIRISFAILQFLFPAFRTKLLRAPFNSNGQSLKNLSSSTTAEFANSVSSTASAFPRSHALIVG